MNSFFVFSSPFGPVAFTSAEIEEARDRANDVLPKDREVSESAVETESQLLDAKEAGAELGVKASWFLQRAREGRIHHFRLGKFIRFDVAKLISEAEKQPW